MNLTTNNLITPSHPIISKIRKLMTTSADAAATPEEANTALQIAQRLPTDLAVAVELFAWAQEKMRAEVRAFCVTRGGLPVTSVAGRSFADGFALALLHTAQKNKKARQKSTEAVVVEVAAGQRALVLISDAEASLDRALTVKAKQGIGKGRGRYIGVDTAARVAGSVSGRSVNLSREVIR